MNEINQVPSKVLLQRARTADQAKDYASAVIMYQEAVGALLSEIHQNKNKIQISRILSILSRLSTTAVLK